MLKSTVKDEPGMKDENEDFQKKKVAFIDIDGTLIRKMSSERLFFKYLVYKRIVTPRDILRYLKVSLNRFINYEGLQLKKNKYYLKGKKVDVIFEIARGFFSEKISPHISKEALREINSLRDKGYTIILLSGTLSFLVDCFKNHCNADLGVGTKLVSDNGVFTGEISGIYAYGKGKADIVKRLEKKYNIDLNNSYAYANHYTDVKHMRLMGYPIAVNAGTRLHLYAKRNNWCTTKF
jgi:HAD superfamily hydrolase (TIGR01490 family)